MIHTLNGILFGHEKGGCPAVCDNMDGPWACYPKWDKSEGQVLHGIT